MVITFFWKGVWYNVYKFLITSNQELQDGIYISKLIGRSSITLIRLKIFFLNLPYIFQHTGTKTQSCGPWRVFLESPYIA